MTKTITIVILSVLVTTLCFVAFYFYQSGSNNINTYLQKELLLKDSISSLQKEIDDSHLRQSVLQHSYDSMLNIEPQIIYRTNETVKFIYGDASPSQLDSIIRSNWKIETGHN